MAYLDEADVTDVISEARNYFGIISPYGESSTAADTGTKVVSCSNFKLVTGAYIIVKFTVTNTASVGDLKLNVNNTGAKSIKYRGNNLSSAGLIASGRVYLFVYDGNNYNIIGDLDTNDNTVYYAGTGLALSGTTFNHSNSVSAQSTQGLYPITFDAQGHIVSAGSAVTPLTASSTLDATKLSGTIPTACLPSYVDDVLEYISLSSFPATGETGKIYVDTTTNKTYRWSGTAYVEISESLALGITSSTAYRGDLGKTAYDHATDSSKVSSAQSSGFYKLSVTSEGHVGSVTSVTKNDLTGLGVPAQDTTYDILTYQQATDNTSSAGGLISGQRLYDAVIYILKNITWSNIEPVVTNS